MKNQSILYSNYLKCSILYGFTQFPLLELFIFCIYKHFFINFNIFVFA